MHNVTTGEIAVVAVSVLSLGSVSLSLFPFLNEVEVHSVFRFKMVLRYSGSCLFLMTSWYCSNLLVCFMFTCSQSVVGVL